MKKILAVIVISITILLCGCGTTATFNVYGTDIYKDPETQQEYIVFTTTDGGLFVVERNK